MNKKNIIIFALSILALLAGFFWFFWSYLKKKTVNSNPVTGNTQKDYFTTQNVINRDDSIEVIAGETLPNNSVVAIIDNKAYLFDSTNSAHFDVKCGFVLSGIATNETVIVYISGTLSLNNNTLQPNTKYFAGVNGNLIDEIPSNYGIQSVGYAISTNQIILDFSERFSYE